MQRKPSPDKIRPDLGADHDEVAERAYMKRQMEAKKKAELKLFRIDLMKQLNGVEDEET